METKPLKDFTAILFDSSECCSRVNRNRHNVNAVVHVREGKVPKTYTCSWCGSTNDITPHILRELKDGIFCIVHGDGTGIVPVEIDGEVMDARTIEPGVHWLY